MAFDITRFKNIEQKSDRYEQQISRIKGDGKDTSCIEKTVEEAEKNLSQNVNSFIIYGDPQSGKTEMMIALTAKLLDKGNKIIVILLNDNVGLLEQNLRRFSKSGLDPDPKNYKEILDDVYQIKDYEWVIFCKKNSDDLPKLIKKIGKNKKVIIDDEADYASPNGKVGKEEITTINRLVGQLIGEIGKDGVYIGVTATPARLDLNNTFENANDKWIYFTSHKFYIGQDEFFPVNLNSGNLKYQLKFLPEQYDLPKYIREALFRFMVNTAYLNLFENNQETYYSMLIHTSGKTSDHLRDHNDIVSAIDILKDETRFDKYVKDIHEIASDRYGEQKANDITEYILRNKNRNAILVVNSKKDKENLDKAANPKSLFTIAIGGNIISRGVTFDNLLSMYFTRTVKTKLQQDTYIQRARMFGARGDYLKYFELTIPEQLYKDWHRCFFFHRLALDSVKNGNPPVWPEDKRTRAVARASIDKTTVKMDSGEMSYEVFKLSPEIEELIPNTMVPLEKLKRLRDELGDQKLPLHLINIIAHFSPDGINSLAIHSPRSIEGYKDADKMNISRKKGLIGDGDLEKDKFPHAIHHIKIFFNSNKEARIFYKFIGIDGIKFLKNFKKD